MKFIKHLLFFLVFVFLTSPLVAAHNSSYTVGKTSDMKFLAQELMGRGVSVSPYGKFVGTTNGDQVGWYSNLTCNVVSHFTNGVIISTGDIEQGAGCTNTSVNCTWGNAEYMNFSTSDDRDYDLEKASYTDDYGTPRSQDVAGIVLYVTPSNSTINIPFMMASEEFFYPYRGETPTYRVPSSVDSYRMNSDMFAFFLKKGELVGAVNADDLRYMGFTKEDNIATLPNGDIVEIASVNQHTNSEFFVANVVTNNMYERLVFPTGEMPLPMEYNGAIVGPVAVCTNVVPGEVYTLKIVLADNGDRRLNSVIFLQGVTSGADLKMDVTSTGVVDSNRFATFTDTVYNVGPVVANGIVVTNYLPIGVSPADVELDLPSSGSITEWGQSGETNFFVWAVGDGLKVKKPLELDYPSETLTFKCKLPESGSTFTNIAEVSTITGDYDLSNNKDDAIAVANALQRLRIEAISTNKVYGSEISLADLGFILSIDGTNETQIVSAIDVTFTNELGQVAYPTNSLAPVGTYGICLANISGFDLAPYGNRIDYIDGKIEITRRPITIKARDDNKIYDGTPLTCGEIYPIEGLSSDDNHQFIIEMTPESTITNAGTQPNVIATVDGEPVEIKVEKEIGNYLVTTIPGELTVEPVDVTLIANSDTFTYDGTEKTVTGYNSSVDGLNFPGVDALGKGTNAGEYDVTFSGVTVGTTTDETGNYRVADTIDGKLTIIPADVTLIAYSDTFKYDGTEKTVIGFESSVDGLTFTGVEAKGSGTKAGTYDVTFSGVTVGTTLDETGNYKVIATIDGKLKIVPADVTLIANSDNFKYDGTEKSVTGYKSSVDGLNFPGVDAFGKGTDAGTYDVTFSGVTVGTTTDETGNYRVADTIDGKLKIDPADVILTANSDTFTYDGTEKTVTGYKSSVDGLNFPGVDALGKGTDAGEYDVTFSGVVIGKTTDKTGNYKVSGTTDGKLKIDPADVTLIANSDNFKYDGTEKSVTGYKSSVDGLNFPGVDAFGKGTDAGTYDVTFSGVTVGTTTDETGNYKVIATTDGKLKIDPADVTLTANSDTFTYDGTEKTVTGFKSSIAGLNFSGVEAFGKGTKAGTYDVIFSGVTVGTTTDETGNYKVIATTDGKLKIDPADVTLTANSDTFTYDGTEKTVTGFKSSISGLNFPGVNALGKGTNAGEYDVTFGGVTVGTTTDETGNYKVIATTDGKLKIDPAQVTLIANSDTFTYDGTEKTVTGFKSSISGLNFPGVNALGKGTNAGEYDVTFSGVTVGTTTDETGNYKVISTTDGKLKITPAQVTLTANSDTFTYDGTEKTVAGFESSIAGLNFPGVEAFGKGTNAGEYDVTFTGVVIGTTKDSKGNYVVSGVKNGKLKINPAEVTIEAADKTKKYDNDETTDPALTATTTGLLNGDTISYSLSRAPGQEVGNYTITVTVTGHNPNYNVTTLNGTFKIYEAEIIIKAKDDIKKYGEEKIFDEINGFTYEPSTLPNGVTINSVTLTSDGAPASAPYKEGGYDIVPSAAQGTGLNNYLIKYENGKLLINKPNLTIVANDATKAYGEELTFNGTEFTTIPEVLPNNEKVTSVVITSSEALDADTDVGVYTNSIAPFHMLTGINTNNYDIVFSNGTLTVTQSIVTITVNDAIWRVGKPKPEFSYADFTAQLKAGDTIADITGGAGEFSDVVYTNTLWSVGEPTKLDAGLYSDEIWIDVSSIDGVKSANYLININPGDLTILAGEAKLKTSLEESLNWNTGLLDLSITVKNEGDREVEPEFSYWVELAPGPAASGDKVTVNKSYYIASPMGAFADGREYVDLTSAVKSALKATGNGDELFDPGEVVTLTGVSLYHWKRWSVANFINADKFFVAGIMPESVDNLKNQEVSIKTNSSMSSSTMTDDDIIDAYVVTKTEKLYGAMYDGDQVLGAIELKLGKVNAKKGTGSISGNVITLDGKKHSIKSVKISGIDGISPITTSLEVKDLGLMSITIGGKRFSGSLGEYHVQSALVGGEWANKSSVVKVDLDDLTVFAGEVIKEFLPYAEPISVTKGKWSLAKPAKIKYAKLKDPITREVSYGLMGFDDPDKPNLSAIKLNYAKKNGTFKGSFKVYSILNNKLKSYTVNVTGVVVDGVGYGEASYKKSSAKWDVIVYNDDLN